MNNDQLSPESALALHKQFLGGLREDVMQIFTKGDAGVLRLAFGLKAYWDSSLKRRDVRHKILAATAGTALESKVEPLGRPFQLMIQAELNAAGRDDAAEFALSIYDEARDIAVAEAVSGEKDLSRREALLDRILQ